MDLEKEFLRKNKLLVCISLLAFLFQPLFAAETLTKKKEKPAMSIYDFEVKTIDEKTTSLQDKKGKVLLIVNVASKCGFTKQYEGLEKLYKKYQEKGFEILGFPCNQFGQQEPGSEQEIKHFCELTYHVTFPLFAKINVNGPSAHPLYVYLKSQQKGFLNTEMIKWNFTKFLIDKKGNVIDRYAPKTEPEEISQDIEKLLSVN